MRIRLGVLTRAACEGHVVRVSDARVTRRHSGPGLLSSRSRSPLGNSWRFRQLTYRRLSLNGDCVAGGRVRIMMICQ